MRLMLLRVLHNAHKANVGLSVTIPSQLGHLSDFSLSFFFFFLKEKIVFTGMVDVDSTPSTDAVGTSVAYFVSGETSFPFFFFFF